MAKLKLGPIFDEKPVRITAELPANVYRDLLAYSEALGRQAGRVFEPAQLVAPMLAQFMTSDRGFAKTRRLRVTTESNATNKPADAAMPARETSSESA